MTDYSNWREWKEVEVHSSAECLQENEQYSPEDIKELCDRLIQTGEERGLEGCYLRFLSHQEPYENWLGDPSVRVVGYRKHTPAELKQIAEEDELETVAKQLNITLFEAKILKQLKDKGVL